MGCGCGGSGSRAGRSGSTRRMLTKSPGYTWDGPEAEQAEAEQDEQPEQTAPDPEPAA